MLRLLLLLRLIHRLRLLLLHRRRGDGTRQEPVLDLRIRQRISVFLFVDRERLMLLHCRQRRRLLLRKDPGHGNRLEEKEDQVADGSSKIRQNGGPGFLGDDGRPRKRLLRLLRLQLVVLSKVHGDADKVEFADAASRWVDVKGLTGFEAPVFFL